ncbi:MAG: hypothetical protein PUF62_11855, partial [Bacteroidales bacterium]|nr:hypothetical protein [Bacteroidales bacterium]
VICFAFPVCSTHLIERISSSTSRVDENCLCRSVCSLPYKCELLLAVCHDFCNFFFRHHSIFAIFVDEDTDSKLERKDVPHRRLTVKSGMTFTIYNDYR